MRVLTDAITVNGGVRSSNSTVGGLRGNNGSNAGDGMDWIVADDWEPRSFGPVTFAFKEVTKLS